jgi:hypothetical protein
MQHLSFVFQFFGDTLVVFGKIGHNMTQKTGNWWDKTGWSIPMEEQPNVAFIHAYKHFYNYQPE